MSGFWKGQRVTITVLQRRQYKSHEFHWHTVHRYSTMLDTDTLETVFDEYDMANHRVIITPVREVVTHG